MMAGVGGCATYYLRPTYVHISTKDPAEGEEVVRSNPFKADEFQWVSAGCLG